MSVTLVIIILTCGISILAFNNPDLQRKLMFSPYRVKHHGEWYRAITHAFIHKDWMHLIFNMYVLFGFGFKEIVAGYPIEDQYLGVEGGLEYIYGFKGVVMFVAFYLGGFLFATLPSMYKHGDNPGYWSLGASGAVSAVLFGFILMYPSSKLMLLFLPIPIPAIVFGLLYMGYEIYMDKKGGGNVAHDAHIWGALFGLVFLIILNFDFLRKFIDELKDLF